MKRIGVFGGSFNPIHLGHLRVAKEVLETFALDRMLFVPSAIPPHKTSADMAPAADRLEMVRLAMQLDSGFTLSDIEIERAGVSYTIDTVRHFIDIGHPDQRLYLVLGMDAFLEIDTWKATAELLQRVPFIVMTRPDGSVQTGTQHLAVLARFITRKIAPDYRFSKAASCFRHAVHHTIHIAPVSALAISGTAIRSAIRGGRSIRFLVPRSVETYIQDKGLYL